MKTITKNCQYCDKEMKSLYQKQIDYNMDAHELSCKKNPKNIKEESEETKNDN